jgi:trypsin
VPVADRRCRRHHYGCVAVLLAAGIGVSSGSLLASSMSAPATAVSPRAVVSVVGGARVRISRFPFQVALYDPRLGPLKTSVFCGGVIVDARHVITAAHCLAGMGRGPGGVSRDIGVLAGSARLDRPDPGSVRDPALQVSIDPSYDPASSDYDIGIITLKRPLWRGSLAPSPNGASAIAPLAIDAALAADYGAANATPATVATVSGWGDTNPAPFDRPHYPSALRSVSVPLVPKAPCQEIYAVIKQRITPRMLCAGGSRRPADACFGDSGGPLVVDRENPARPPEDYVLVGLVDFGIGCAWLELPAVYTRIGDPAIARYLASHLNRRVIPTGHR